MRKLSWIAVGIVFVVVVVLVARREGADKRKTLEEAKAGGERTVQLEEKASSGGKGAVPFKSGPEVVAPTIAYSNENLGAPVKALLGLDEQEQNYNSLGKAVSELSMDLSADEVAALLEFVTWSNDRFPDDMRPIEINSVKNDVLDRLLRQNELPEDIGSQLVEMASNIDSDPVWRNYCIQFMTPFYERVAAESGTTEYTENTESDQSASSAGEIKAVREAMFAALDERDGTMAGTSLIGLELLSRTHDEFDREAIIAKTTEIAADESASASSRLTALRLAAEVETAEDTADTARTLAQTGETVLLRSAAIVTLGEVGSDTDRELLESYTLADNQQITDAAKLALQKMDARSL